MHDLIWEPTERERKDSNLARFIRQHDFPDYDSLHRWSVREPADFWQAVAKALGIQFRKPPRQGLDLSAGVERPQWFPDAELNIVESCFQPDRSCPSMIWGTRDGQLHRVSQEELRRDMQRVALGLRQQGFKPGSRLAVMMPMTPESVAIYLGIIHSGSVVISIADSFAPQEVERRLRIASADGLFCIGGYARSDKWIDLYERVCAAAAPRSIVLPPRSASTLRAGDLTWEAFLASGDDLECHIGTPQTWINLLFSSGTTGDPKAIPWKHTTPIKCAADGYFHQDIQPGDVTVWPTNLGWMMGPWLIFATLINRASMGLFEDVTDATGFGRFVQDARVTMLGLVPTLVRNWRAAGCMEQFDWSAIRCFSSTGEASSPEDMAWLSRLAGGKPVIEYCGGTEIGGGYITSSPLHANRAGAFACPALGNRFVILDESGHESAEGELFLVPPALGLSTELLNRDHHATYFEGCPTGPRGEVLRRHGDHFRRLENGMYVAGGRVDDTMNLGGIKISSAELEAVLNGVPGIHETAAVSIPAPNRGPDQLVVFVVLAADRVFPSTPTDQNEQQLLKEQLQRAFNEELKQRLNPLFRVSRIEVIDRLPRTASNKVMRRELRDRLRDQFRE